MSSVNMNVHVKPYTARVLGVIKEKYGLRNKDQALDKFAEMFGYEFVELDVKENVVREIIKTTEQHIKKHGLKPISDSELDKICGVSK